MKWFYNLKISIKLLTGFIIVAIIAGVVGAVGILNIQSIKESDALLYTVNTVPISEMATIMEKYQRIRVNGLDVIINKDAEAMNENMTKIEQYKKDMESNMTSFEKTIVADEVRKEFEVLKSLLNDEFTPYIKNVTDLGLANKNDQAHTLTQTTGDEINKKVQSSMENLFKLKVDSAKEKADSNSSTAQTAIVMMIVFVIIAIVLAIGLGVFISRIISKPIRELVGTADKLSMGDINVSVEATTKDEIGSLMQAFSKMIENIRNQAFAVEKIASGDLTIEVKAKSENDLLGKKLSELINSNNEVLGNINSASEQVAAGARQVSESSQMLSQGSTEQASSVEEITSSITQVAAQTKQNAINANQANEFAVTAKDNAIQGNSRMQDMVKAMSEINDSSANISKIIKVIDEIAFQTNILALNAAVEAARAGQHGKGFAVVAEEVRNLAARSANAAKETTEMIEGSIKKVEVGTKLANETAAALNNIVGDVTKAAALVGDIATASNEQATGISQINTAIEQVAQVVQTNSATSEECASASEELSSQAELLKDSVRRFKLKKIKVMGESFGNISPEMMHMIEGLIEKKNNENAEVAAVSAKPKISLDNNDFGKY
ncbi:MAG: methyl-accepting chemotaxis protein [Ruminiclostridium sp.]